MMDAPYWKETTGALAAFIGAIYTIWTWKERQRQQAEEARRLAEEEKEKLERRLDDGSKTMAETLHRMTGVEEEMKALPTAAEVATLRAQIESLAKGQAQIQASLQMIMEALLREKNQ